MPPKAALISRQKALRVDGLTEVRASVAALPQAFREVVADDFDVAGNIILSETAMRAPVGTRALQPGHVRLRESLGRNDRDDGLQIAVGFGDFTAKFVEFGTNDTRPQPSLYPAFRLGVRYVRGKAKTWAVEAGKRVRVGVKRSKGARSIATKAVARRKALG